MSVFLVQDAVGLAQQSQALILCCFIEAVNVTGHIDKHGRRQALQVFENGFDDGHIHKLAPIETKASPDHRHHPFSQKARRLRVGYLLRISNAFLTLLGRTMARPRFEPGLVAR